ncbi:MAG: hypothetical protein ACRCUJ_14980 [Phocaeicola sp.]
MELNNIGKTGNWGALSTLLNDNFAKIIVEVLSLQGMAAGGGRIYSTLANLQTAFPSPKSGNWGYVSSTLSFPATIYTYNGTSWVAGGTGSGGDSVSSVNAALTSALSSLSSSLSTALAAIVAQAQQYLPVQNDGWYFTDADGNTMVSVTEDGLDAARLAPNFIDLIKSIDGIADSALLNKLLLIVAELKSRLIAISSDSFSITDEGGNIGMRYDNNGLDVALLSAHFISLIKQIDGLGLVLGETSTTAYAGDKGKLNTEAIKTLTASVNTLSTHTIFSSILSISEGMFAIVDEQGNIGFKVDEDGSIGEVEYELVSEVAYDV